MAKKIIVNEGDDLRIVKNVTRLVTKLKNGNEIAWLPEDETQLITKTIIKDGTYIAFKEAEKAYGYSQVTVSGVGSKVMGELGEKKITENGTYIAKDDKNGPFYGYSKIYVNVPNADDGDGDGGGSKPVGKDGDGDDAVIGTDDDGNIVTTKLPTRISISVYPNNLVYEDGQTIDFTGLRVKAFLPDGTEWGVVPSDEILTPVTVAEYDKSTGQEEWTDGAGLNALRIMYTPHQFAYISWTGKRAEIQVYCSDVILGVDRYGYPATFGGGDTEATLFITRYAGYNYAASISGDGHVDLYSRLNGEPDNPWGYKDAYGFHSVGGTAARAGQNTFEPVSWEEYLTNIPVSTVTPSTVDPLILSATDSQQTIPLQWWRPGDHKVLETSFSIAVHSS